MSENKLTGKHASIPLEQRVKNVRRFHGLRYSLRSTSTTGPNYLVPEVTGFMTFPKEEDIEAEGKGILD